MKKRIKIKKEGEDKGPKWLIYVGIILFLIWLFDTVIKMRYLGEYDFLWFCSISLLLLSIAYIFRNSTFMISFLPIAVEVQILWMANYFLLIFAMNPITQNTNYMFDSGQGLFNFIIGLKHLFIIPLALIGLKYIKKPPMKYSWIFFMLIGLAIVVFSPMSPLENLNCASFPCWTQSSGYHISEYTLFYSIWFYIVSVIISGIAYVPIYFLVKKAKIKNKGIKEKNTYMKILNIIIIIFLAIVILGILLGFWRYFQKPHYECINEKSDLYCERAISKNSTNDLFSYHLTSKLGNKCNVTAYVDGKVLANREQIIYENPSKGYIPVPIPTKNTKVLIRAVCANI